MKKNKLSSKQIEKIIEELYNEDSEYCDSDGEWAKVDSEEIISAYEKDKKDKTTINMENIARRIINSEDEWKNK